MRHKPYTVKIELTRGCNRRCPFCALPYMPWANEEYRFMEVSTFTKAITDAGKWIGKFRLELAERGEPSLHPNLVALLMIARKFAPRCQIMITTNAVGLKNGEEQYRQFISSLFDAGLNIAYIDGYDDATYDKLQRIFPFAEKMYEDGVHPYQYHSPTFKQIILVGGHHGEKNIIRQFHNMAGTLPVDKVRKLGYEIMELPDGKPLEKMCVRPFRETVIHYDGTVTICCNDWYEVSSLGNVKDSTLEELFGRADFARAMLIAHNRAALRPCNTCSERSGFRVGLETGWFK